MKKDTKKTVARFILSFLQWVIPIIAIFWIGGLTIEMVRDLSSQAKSFFITYGQISLTLFGFTMVGAIFEKKQSKSVKNLFYLSILFLSSAIAFFFLHSMTYYDNLDNYLTETIFGVLILVSLLVSLLGFVYGIWFLLRTLIQHWEDIDK